MRRVLLVGMCGLVLVSLPSVTANDPPALSFTWTTKGTTVYVSANVTDPNGDRIHTTDWLWGDRTPNADGYWVCHNFGTAGSYDVTLAVEDGLGLAARTTLTVQVPGPYAPDSEDGFCGNGEGWNNGDRSPFGSPEVYYWIDTRGVPDLSENLRLQVVRAVDYWRLNGNGALRWIPEFHEMAMSGGNRPDLVIRFLAADSYSCGGHSEWLGCGGLDPHRGRRHATGGAGGFGDLVAKDQFGRFFPPDCVYVTAVHEIGHALGLPHSLHPLDPMYTGPGHAQACVMEPPTETPSPSPGAREARQSSVPAPSMLWVVLTGAFCAALQVRHRVDSRRT